MQKPFPCMMHVCYMHAACIHSLEGLELCSVMDLAELESLSCQLCRHGTPLSLFVTFPSKDPLYRLNLISGSILVSLWKLHSGRQGKTKREPDTNLLRNICRPLFWSIDICRISQPKLLPLFVFLVCKFFTRGKKADWLLSVNQKEPC